LWVSVFRFQEGWRLQRPGLWNVLQPFCFFFLTLKPDTCYLNDSRHPEMW
jgi:hypothetical protein